MKRKMKEWIWRYLPQEVAGLTFGMIGALVTQYYLANPVAVAFIATWSESFGFYLYGLTREVRVYLRVHPRGKFRVIFFKSVRDLALEFGVAGVLDDLTIRPFFIYLMPKVIGNFPIGVFAGMMCANVIFYSFSIIGYELKKKHLKR
ncbi:MAG: hypothetical protein NTX63_00335 [Candidatus Peregrinibacteria bacterium]|nr:hypothetical protein [Candidatus Peregrinibacteria bacterium]